MYARVFFLALVVPLVGSCSEGKTGTPAGPDLPVATTVTLSPSSFTFTSLDETTELTATVRDQDGGPMSGAAVTWISSNTSIADVAQDGWLRAVDNGTARITATSGNASGWMDVTVSQVAASLTPVLTSVTLDAIADTVRLDMTVFDALGSEIVGAVVSWSVVGPAIVTISPEGLMTALDLGTTTIRCVVGPLTADVEVTVGLPERILFSSNEGGDRDIYVMDPDGSNVERLTDVAGTDDMPKWSPDGTKIAFQSNRDGDFDIYVMDADGSNQTALTVNTAFDVEPSWSPDGSQIAFRSGRDANSNIYVMNADGSAQTRITSHPASDIDPQWSPDGTKIAFVTFRDGDYEVYVMAASGANPIRLTHTPGTDDSPSWSPDGTQIAFSSYRDGSQHVYVMGANGSNPVQLTTSSSPDRWPAWSPEGDRIVFGTARHGNWELYVVDATGANLTRLTTTTADNLQPDWAR